MENYVYTSFSIKCNGWNRKKSAPFVLVVHPTKAKRINLILSTLCTF